MTHKIYGLYADVDDVGFPLIRYVGYTSKTLKTRLIQHLSDARQGDKSHRCNWIRSLIAEGRFPLVILLESVTSETWRERECFWISKFGARLTNGTMGGEGLINPSPEVRGRISQKVSELLKGNSRRLGVLHSPQDRERISAGLRSSQKAREAWDRKKGISPSLETREKIGAAQRGKNKTAEHRAKIKNSTAAICKENSERRRGMRWVTDGSNDICIAPDVSIPIGFRIGRSKHNGTGNKNGLGYKHNADARARMSAAASNFNWINDGVSLKKLQKGDPLPAGWIFGKKIVK